MRLGINKRTLIIVSSSLGLLIALVAAAFFGYVRPSQAASSTTNPHVLSSNFLSTHRAQARYGDLGAQGPARAAASKVAKSPAKNTGTSACIPGINGVSNFCGTFSENGFDASGNPNSTWIYNMLGNFPQNGGTTSIDAPIIPVKVELIGSNGKPAFTIDPTKDVKPTVKSPVFSKTTFSSSSKPTQFGDAVQRAEFNGVETANWHTVLDPSVQPEVTMKIPFGFWNVGLNPDNSIAFTLVDSTTFQNLLFPATLADRSHTIIGREELNGTMTTKNISTFLFDNVYLYEGNVNNCCVLGFHGPDMEPGKNNIINNFDMIYASWITPGLFQGGAADITALSHEVSETYNDPFGGAYFPYAYVPWWFSGPNPAFTQCQPLMEVGDVVEVYTVVENDVFPITMNGMTYNPQTEALLQWFEGQTPSTAIDHAYSYPGENILTSAAVSQMPGCTGPA